MPPVNSTGGYLLKVKNLRTTGNPRRGFPTKETPPGRFFLASCAYEGKRIPLSAESGKGFAPSPHHLLKKGAVCRWHTNKAPTAAAAKTWTKTFNICTLRFCHNKKFPAKMPGISDFYDYAKSSACSSIFDKNQLCPLSGLP